MTSAFSGSPMDQSFSPHSLVPSLSEAHAPSLSRVPSVTLLLRRNGLYEGIAQQVAEQLEKDGVVVRQLIVPATIGEQEFQRLLSTHQVELSTTTLVCDYTSYRALSQLGPFKPRVILDEICSRKAQEIVPELRAWGQGDTSLPVTERHKDPTFYASQDTLERCGAAIRKLLSQAFVTQMPERIDIFTGSLLDHLPFYGYRLAFTQFHAEHLAEGSPIDEELFEAYRKDSFIDAPVLHELEDEFHTKLPQPHEAICRWIVEAGFPEENIRVIFDYDQLHAADYGEEKSVWIMGDRHLLNKQAFLKRLYSRCDGDYNSALFTEAELASRNIFAKPCLRFPLENFVSDLLTHKLIEANTLGDSTEFKQSAANEIIKLIKLTCNK